MSGLCGFGHEPGVRRLPRPAAAGWHRDLVSVLRLLRRRAGSGHGGTPSGDGCGRGVLRVRTVTGREAPAQCCKAPHSAARVFPAPAEGAARCGVQPHGIEGAAERPCRRAAGRGPGAPCRGAVKAAASSRFALTLRRASVVSTANASERVETTPGSSGRRNRNCMNEGGLWSCNAMLAALWANNARKRRVRNGESSTFFPDPLASGAFLRPTGIAPVAGCRVRAGYPTRAPRGLSWSAPLRGIGMR